MTETAKDRWRSDTNHVLWDVAEEHLEEAAFGIRQFQRSLESSVITLDDLARYPESRLLAHVDALVVAGEPVRTRYLRRALEAAHPAESATIAAASWALIEAGDFAALYPALMHEDLEVREAVATAARGATHPELDQWVRESLSRESNNAARAGFLELSLSRGLPSPPLLAWLQSDNQQLVQAAARAARFADSSYHLPVMQYLLGHESPDIRDSALLACLSWGSQDAWSRCQRWALDETQPSVLATLLMVTLGGRAEHALLVERASGSSQCAHWLFALGFSGNIAIADFFLDALSGEARCAKLAAQALGLTFGFLPFVDQFAASSTTAPLPPADDGIRSSLPSLEDDDLEADLVPLPEDMLPTPNASSIVAFCEERRSALRPAKRVLFGAEFSLAQLAKVFVSCPMRWRQPLAVALGVRTAGRYWLDTCASTRRQRQQLTEIPTIRHQLRHLSF